METKIDCVVESRADGKVLPRRLIIFGLEDDQKWTVLRKGCPLFGAWRSSDIGMPFCVILVEVIEFGHQLPAADGAIRRIKRHGHVPWATIA